MDSAGCPKGFATDHVFMYGSDFVPGACDANVTFFAACMGVLSALRILLAAAHTKLWINKYWNQPDSRKKVVLNKTSRSRRRQLPIFPIFSALAAISISLFTILVCCNVATAANGLPAFFLGLFYWPLCISSMIMSQRIVTAGRKLIPLSTMMLNSSDSSTDNASTNSRLKRLEKVDGFLRITRLVGFTASIFLLPASLIVAALISPTFVPFQIGLISLFITDWCVAAGMGYQFQRVINAIKAIQRDQRNGTDGAPSFVVASARVDAVNAAIKRMRSFQVGSIIGCITASFVWVLNASRAVLPHYWFAILYFGIEVISMGFMAIFGSLRGSSAAGTTTSGTNSREVAAGVTENVTAIKSSPSTFEPSVNTAF